MRHQAIARHVEAEALPVRAGEFEVGTAVVINEENTLIRLQRIATLNNVVTVVNGASGTVNLGTDIVSVEFASLAHETAFGGGTSTLNVNATEADQTLAFRPEV